MDTTPTPLEALHFALNAAGSQSELARICSISQPAVWKWLQSSKRVPAEHVLAIEAATGVSRHHLRPDIYPVDLPAAPARWSGVDRCVGSRSNGIDSRAPGAHFNRRANSQGAAA